MPRDAIAPSLRFEPTDHTYWLGNRQLISVTTALKEAGLIDTTWFSDAAAERGTYVHAACDLLDDGNLGECLPEHAGYVAAYQQFLDDIEPQWHQREQMVYDEVRGYAGKLDRAGYINDQWTVVDIKTGPKSPWHGLQLAAYARLALSPDRNVKPWRRALYLTKHGQYALEPYTNSRTEEGIFLAALTVAQFRRANGYGTR